MREYRQKLVAVFLGLMLVGLVEGVLCLAGVSPLSEEDRFVDFSGQVPLFIGTESHDGESVFTLNPVKSDYFNRQSFRMPKPPRTFRLVALGGSTTYGRPYLGETAFARWLSVLGNRFGGPLSYQEINAGGISYASYRAARLQKELLNYNPDLFVVYSGHNEFLEARTFAALKDEAPWLSRVRETLHHSRLYSLLARSLGGWTRKAGGHRTLLPAEVSVELETVAGPDYYHRDETFRQGVLDHYRASLQRMIDRAAKQRVPLVLCTLPSNLSGISPFKSEHRQGLTAQQLAEWEQWFDRGNRAMAGARPEEAVGFYQQALLIDDRYALLAYRLGQAFDQVGRSQDAYRAYVLAKQEDIIPLRALDEMNGIVRELAASNGVPLADVEALFRRVAVDGIPGSDLFDDHVHPNIRGQQLIAWCIFDTLVKEKLIPLDLREWQRQVRVARDLLQHYEQRISPRYRALGQFGVGRLYFWAGKYAEAYRPLKQAYAELRDNAEIPFKLGALEVFRGDGAAAIPLLKEALRLQPQHHDAEVMLANAYLLEGQADEALTQLDKLPAERETSIGFLSARGRALLLREDFADGLADLERAYGIAPEAPRTIREYAEALARAGQLRKAESMFSRYLEKVHSPDPEGALRRWVRGKGWEKPRRWLSEESGYQ